MQWPGHGGNTLMRLTMTPANGGRRRSSRMTGRGRCCALLDAAQGDAERPAGQVPRDVQQPGGTSEFELNASSVRNPFTHDRAAGVPLPGQTVEATEARAVASQSPSQDPAAPATSRSASIQTRAWCSASMTGSEELGRPFRSTWSVERGCQGRPALAARQFGDDGITLPARASATSTASSPAWPMAALPGGAYRYRIELRPWIWLLTRMQDCPIFQNQTAFRSSPGVFPDAGFSDFQDKRQNQRRRA